MTSHGKENNLFTALVFAILGYEWLVSGLDKVLSGTFVSHLHEQMTNTLSGMQYLFYGQLLEKFCLPHCIVVGILIETGEILAGLVFLALAVATFMGVHNRLLYGIGILSGLVTAFMSINFFFYEGGYYFLNMSDPFDEGIPIDLVMFLMELGTAAYCYWMAGTQKSSRLARVGSKSSEALRG